MSKLAVLFRGVRGTELNESPPNTSAWQRSRLAREDEARAMQIYSGIKDFARNPRLAMSISTRIPPARRSC